MRVLVTGANGLLGSHLVRESLAAGHQVRALVRRTSNLRGLGGLDIDLVYGDVRDGTALRAAADGCEVMFHAAAVFAYAGYDRDDMDTTARQGARNAVEAAKDAGVRRLVFTSTTAVLGHSETPEARDEAGELTDSGAPQYFTSKAAAERVAVARARDLHLELVLANPGAFMGPNDWKPSPSLQIVTGYLQDPIKSTYAGGVNISHAQDVAQGHLLLAERAAPFERYILAAENLEWSSIHRMIAELCGLPEPRLRATRAMAYVTGAAMEIGSLFTRRPPLVNRAMARQVGAYFWYRNDKAVALGYAPRAARDTLASTIAWAIDTPFVPPRVRRALHPVPEVISLRGAATAS